MITNQEQLEKAQNNKLMPKILIIDDDISTTLLIDNIFSKEGYEIRTVNISTNTIPEALLFRPDLIILDLMMPDTDGIETCKALKANSELRKTPILMFSAVGDVKRKVEAFNAGARDFITKPVHVEELKSRIKAWLNSQES
jgi:DNA-binding response OmpR family regulator